MRVLLTTDAVGGVWTFTQELSEHLLAGGHAVALVSFGRAPSEWQHAWATQQTARFGHAFQFTPCDSPLEWMQDNRSVFAQGVDLLLRIAHEFRADVLHSNQFCWGALPLDIPKLITAHSDVMSWAQAVDPSILLGSPWLSRYCSLVQQGLDGADAVVAPTLSMRQASLAHFRVHVPFDVIYNGRTVPTAYAPAARTLQAITVGRLWDEAKGLAILLDSEPPMPVLIAGEERFQHSVAKRMPASLTALGVLDQQQVFDLMRSSSVYLATSVYEPFGLAPLEAALCGCAVVARDLPSFREVWGSAAIYFHSSQELAQALNELKRYPDKLRQFQFAARKRAARYSAAAMTARYADRYARLASAWELESTTHAA